LLKELQEKYGYAELPAKLKSQDQAVSTALSKVHVNTKINLKFISFTHLNKAGNFI